MGDIPPSSGPQPLDMVAAGLGHDEHQGHHPSSSSQKSPSSNTPFYSQLSSIPQSQLRPDLRSPALPASPHYPPSDHGATPLNMGAMTGALPEYASMDASQSNAQMSQHTQRQLSGASTSALVYHLQQNLQVPGPPSGSFPTSSPYGPGFSTGQFQQNFMPAQPSQHANFAAFPPGQQRVAPPGSMQTPYQNFPQPSQYMYYPTQYGHQAQYPQAFPGQSAHGQAMYGRGASPSHAHMGLAGQGVELPQQDGSYPGSRMTSGSGQREPGAVGSMFSGPLMQAQGKSKT